MQQGICNNALAIIQNKITNVNAFFIFLEFLPYFFDIIHSHFNKIYINRH